jgi:hypothetical protein
MIGTRWPGAAQQQQTGMLFIIMQQLQPAFIMPIMQSQQVWIMAQQALSPLVQVIRTPISVASHRHMAIVRLQQQAIIPFIMQQQEHIPPAIMVQRFWIIAAEAGSSLVQVIFIPPAHFSILMVQRGTIIMFEPVGMAEGDPIAPVPVPPMPIIVARSIITVLLMVIPPDPRVSVLEFPHSVKGPIIGPLPEIARFLSRNMRINK